MPGGPTVPAAPLIPSQSQAVVLQVYKRNVSCVDFVFILISQAKSELINEL
jgi:hypothetical protein